MSNDEEKRMELSIQGRVQGVGFRHFTMTTVRELRRTTGWVRNESDGSVTLVAEGPEKELKQLLNAVADGPRRADVRDIDKEIKDSRDEFSSFEVRY